MLTTLESARLNLYMAARELAEHALLAYHEPEVSEYQKRNLPQYLGPVQHAIATYHEAAGSTDDPEPDIDVAGLAGLLLAVHGAQAVRLVDKIADTFEAEAHLTFTGAMVAAILRDMTAPLR